MVELPHVMSVLFGLVLGSNLGVVLTRYLLGSLRETRVTKSKEHVPIITVLGKIFNQAIYGTAMTLLMFWLLPVGQAMEEIELMVIFLPDSQWRGLILIIVFALSAVVGSAGLLYEELLNRVFLQIQKLPTISPRLKDIKS